MPEAITPDGTLLAFDFGLSRIGVAVGQTRTGTANPLETVSNRGEQAWARILQLVDDWRPAALVIGLPLDPDGLETDMCRLARKFGTELANRTCLAVFYQDERLTSRAADETFAAMRAAGARRRKHAGMKDAMAAKIILDNWLQSRQ